MAVVEEAPDGVVEARQRGDVDVGVHEDLGVRCGPEAVEDVDEQREAALELEAADVEAGPSEVGDPSQPRRDDVPVRRVADRDQQTGIGRSPWEQTLILAERDGAVRVAGYRLVQWDRITASSASCDWNLLTGEWRLEAQIQSENGDPRTVTKQGRRPERIAVQDWPAQGEDLAQICRIDLTAP